ncbi:hypothetical protein RHSIM_Rhsim06G0172200 [Rhododendron simsii]|uniref:Uncharacterized protein n=1 Tax=Rhododendron simsii TaxID=118357 RepID=A0A834GY98_RHOSS|nr:hypothetical protein RHSIM_Rhsim06G0172200 [Rhododendron simsii]
MWQMLAVMRRNLLSLRKSPRVADESMFGDRDVAAELPIFVHGMGRRRAGWNGFSILHDILRAPLSLLSCLSHPHNMNGADGAWASSEFALVSEMNQLMVNDSLRYAILM